MDVDSSPTKDINISNNNFNLLDNILEEDKIVPAKIENNIDSENFIEKHGLQIENFERLEKVTLNKQQQILNNKANFQLLNFKDILENIENLYESKKEAIKTRKNKKSKKQITEL